MHKKDKRLKQRGTYSVLTAITIPIIVGIGLIAMDITKFNMASSRVQNYADLAALATMRYYADTYIREDGQPNTRACQRATRENRDDDHENDNHPGNGECIPATPESAQQDINHTSQFTLSFNNANVSLLAAETGHYPVFSRNLTARQRRENFNKRAPLQPNINAVHITVSADPQLFMLKLFTGNIVRESIAVYCPEGGVKLEGYCYCGDGNEQGDRGEQCDDGSNNGTNTCSTQSPPPYQHACPNTIPCDWCTFTCSSESYPLVGPCCGDDTVNDVAEQCDGSPGCSSDCCNPGYHWDGSQCVLNRCDADGIQAGAGEECDPDNSNCDNACHCLPGFKPDGANGCKPACPDGIRDPGEQCDGISGCTNSCQCDEANGYVFQNGVCERTTSCGNCQITTATTLVQGGIATANCPSGTTVTGGGCTGDAINAGQPAGNGFSCQRGGTDFGDGTVTATAYAVCCPNTWFKNKEIVTNTTQIQGGMAVATCPAGKIATGGGCSGSLGSKSGVPSNNSFSCMRSGSDTGDGTHEATAYAICYSAADLGTSSIVSASTLNQGFPISAICPDSAMMTGGGCSGDMHPIDNGHPAGANAYVCTRSGTETGDGAQSVTSHAVCVTCPQPVVTYSCSGNLPDHALVCNNAAQNISENRNYSLVNSSDQCVAGQCNVYCDAANGYVRVRNSCVRLCGNGTINSGEQCEGGEGCNANCQCEPPYAWNGVTGAGSACVATCNNNGLIDDGETGVDCGNSKCPECPPNYCTNEIVRYRGGLRGAGQGLGGTDDLIRWNNWGENGAIMDLTNTIQIELANFPEGARVEYRGGRRGAGQGQGPSDGFIQWEPWRSNGAIADLTNVIQIRLVNAPAGMKIRYRGGIRGTGQGLGGIDEFIRWNNWIYDGGIADLTNVMQITAECVAPVCGNSLVEVREQCDDGNTVDDNNACSNNCRLIPRNQPCPDKPGGDATVWLAGPSFPQTCSRWDDAARACSDWTPATPAATVYGPENPTAVCKYDCSPGYIWNGTACILTYSQPRVVMLEDDYYGSWGFEDELRQGWDCRMASVGDSCDMRNDVEYTCQSGFNWAGCTDTYCRAEIRDRRVQTCTTRMVTVYQKQSKTLNCMYKYPDFGSNYSGPMDLYYDNAGMWQNFGPESETNPGDWGGTCGWSMQCPQTNYSSSWSCVDYQVISHQEPRETCTWDTEFYTVYLEKERQVRCALPPPPDSCNGDSAGIYICGNENKTCVDIFESGLAWSSFQNQGARSGLPPYGWQQQNIFQKWAREVYCHATPEN